MKKPKILLIDDQDDFREILSLRLVQEGYEVLDAPTGQAGIDLARFEEPDLILLDLMMPTMSGYQVWQVFQKESFLRKIPILILTAKLQANDVFWGKNMPASDYLIKTDDIENILKRIAEKLEENQKK